MIKAIIFDCDGLIIDTETAWYRAIQELYVENELDLPLEVYAQCIGSTLEMFDPYQHLAERLTKPMSMENIRSISKEKYTKLIKDQVLRPGVMEYLQAAKRLGLRIGLASSSSRDWVEHYLKTFEIYDYFDTIRTADDVLLVKPNPELYLQAMKALGVVGEEAIVFEDSLNGLRAAKDAGLYCVVVPNEVTSFMDFTNHDLRINSMADLSLDEVINRIEHNNKYSL